MTPYATWTWITIYLAAFVIGASASFDIAALRRGRR